MKDENATLADFNMVWFETTGIIICKLCGFWMGLMVVAATVAARRFWRWYKRRWEV